MAWDLSEYQPVEDRLREFWERHPAGKVITELIRDTEGEYVVMASIFRGDELREDRPAATGLAHEAVTMLPANMRTSALEVAETSAIGRALANLGFAPKGKRPSREEMESASGAGKGGLGVAAASEGTPPPAPDDVGGGGATGEGVTPPSAQRKADHDHQWIQSPRVPKLDICTVPKCGVTRKHEPVNV